MVEGVAIEFPKQAVVVRRNSCSSGSVIQQGKLAESLTRLVLLQEGRVSLAGEDLRAGKGARTDHIETVSVIALLDDHLIAGNLAFLHGIDDNTLLSLVECREHKCQAEFLTDGLLGLS